MTTTPLLVTNPVFQSTELRAGGPSGDGSDNYANKKKLFLSFYHLASDKEVKFKAFIDSYNESFSTAWNYEEVFGRPDPIATFKQTTRNISVSWSIPASTMEEARANLQRCNLLAQFMYPGYSSATSANTLSKPPLMKVRFANLIRNTAGGDTSDAKLGGLLAAVNSLNISPVFDDSSGFFDPGTATLYPKTITVSCDFVALHQHELGWSPEGRFNSDELSDFPYGRTEAPAPSQSPESRANQGDIDINDLPEDADGAEVEAEVDAAVQENQLGGFSLPGQTFA
jgi:hypothetical protein